MLCGCCTRMRTTTKGRTLQWINVGATCICSLDIRWLLVCCEAGTRHGHYNRFNFFIYPLMITIDWRTLIVAGTRHGHYNHFNFFMHPLMITIDWRTLIVASTRHGQCLDVRLSCGARGLVESHVARSLQHAPRLQLTLNGLDVATEEHVIHDPTVEEALRNNPE